MTQVSYLNKFHSSFSFRNPRHSPICFKLRLSFSSNRNTISSYYNIAIYKNELADYF